MKFYATKFFLAQPQRKDRKEAKFVNFGREKHEFPALQASTQLNSHQKHKEETEARILCSLDKHQVPRKS